MDKFPGINVNATGSNVITIGRNNVVNAKYEQLFRDLDTLKETIGDSAHTDTEKLDLAADIETIKEQLAKQQPNRTVIANLWTGIKGALGTLAGKEIVTQLHTALQHHHLLLP